jgi:GNAT superfamily N-acetyltransferase
MNVHAGLGFLWGGGTLPEARGRGAYRAVLAARMRRARELGLGWVGLQARADTSWPVVRRLGFQSDGSMVSWELAAPVAGPPAG